MNKCINKWIMNIPDAEKSCEKLVSDSASPVPTA